MSPSRPSGSSTHLAKLVLAAVLLGTTAASSLAGMFYRVEKSVAASDLSTQADQSVPMVVTGLNPSARMVGFYALTVQPQRGPVQHPLHAFVWDNVTGVARDFNDDLPSANAASSMALCVNSAGTVAGVCWNAQNANVTQVGFVWRDGATTTFLSPEGTDIDSVTAINVSGQVIGTYYSVNDSNLRGFVWDGTNCTDLGDLGDSDNPYIWPQAINDAGQVVGTSYDATVSPPVPTAFVWRNGSISTLDGSDAFSNSKGLAINSTGQLACSYSNPSKKHGETIPGGFSWFGNEATDLGSLGGGNTLPFSIDPTGVVYGLSYAADSTLHLFSWNAGAISDLGAAFLETTDASYQMTGVNLPGDVAGFITDANNNIQATVRTAGQQYRLTGLLPTYLQFTQMSSQYGSQVLLNDSGLVACAGTTASGQQMAFLLAPDPDTDNDGLPDSWEMQYFNHLGVNPGAYAPCGGGTTNLQAYQQGINPTNPNSGLTPVLSVVGGNAFSGAAGALLGTPLEVKVSSLAGTPLANAVVTFQIEAEGGGTLAPVGNSASLSNSLTITTDANGNASALLQLATNGSGHCLVTASAVRSSGSTDVSNAVQFVATVVSSGGLPTTPSNVSFTVQPDGTVKITWSDSPNNADNFIIQGRTAGGDWQTLGTVASSVNSFVAPATANGNGFYRVVAVNAQGQSPSNPSSYGQGPTVTITSPIEGQQTTVNGRFILTAIALDDNAVVTKVEFFEGINKIGEADQSPFSTVWSGVPAGSHTITAVATDAVGAQGTSAAVTVSAIGFKSIAAGGYQSFALQSDGTLWAWGNDYDGEFGNGTSGKYYFAPTQVSGTSGTQTVASGSQHTLILNADGTVSAFGDNSYFQLGTGDTTRWLTPTKVSGLQNVKAIAASGYQSAALTADGTVWTWGMPLNTWQEQYVPTQVTGLPNIIALTAGDGHFLALAADHSVWAWGWNAFGQLGTGDTTDQSTPVQVPGLANVNAIAAGPEHSVAVTSQGTVYTWGDNSSGQLGQGSSDSYSPNPLTVSGLPAVSAVATKGPHVMVLTKNGAVWAFGDNSRGQTGDPATYLSNGTDSSPYQVEYLPTIVQVAAGAYHSLAVTVDGQIFAWGDNTQGQLGTDNPEEETTVNFENVSDLTNTAGSGGGSIGGSSGGNGTPNPGGGGSGPTLDPDQSASQYGYGAPWISVYPSQQTDPNTGETEWDDTTADISWYTYSTPQSMVIQRRDGDGDWQTLGSPSAGDTDYEDDGLKALIAYEYRIEATFAGGKKFYSNVVTYYVPLIEGMSIKEMSASTYKGTWSFHEFWIDPPSAKPKYYLNEVSTYTSEYSDDSSSSNSNGTYTVTYTPAQHSTSYVYTGGGGSSDDSGDWSSFTNNFSWSYQGRSRGQTAETYIWTQKDTYNSGSSNGDDSSSSNSSNGGNFNVTGTYQPTDGAPRWAGYDFDMSLGNIQYAGTYTNGSNSSWSSSDGTSSSSGSSSSSENATLTGSSDTTGPVWTGTSTYNGNSNSFTWNFEVPDVGWEDVSIYGPPTSTTVTNENSANWNGTATLSQEYDTASFIQNSINDLPDPPKDFTDNYWGYDGWDYDYYYGFGSCYIGSRQLAASEDVLSLDKFIYKFKTNPSNSATYGINVLFVPNQDANTPDVLPTPQVVDQFTVTGTGDDSPEHTLDPTTMPDQLQPTSKSGYYNLVPGFHVAASGSITDSNPNSPTDPVYDLDAGERSDGAAVLIPPDSSGYNSVTGTLNLTNYWDGSYYLYGADPASFTYTLNWTNGGDVIVTDGTGATVSSGEQFTQEDVNNGDNSLYYTVAANASAHDNEQITFTISESVGGQSLGQDTVTYTVDLHAGRSYSVPFDEASGARYRKIGLDGRPMQDEKPQHTAESDQEKEQTYVDALTLGLHHSTTDIYVPVAGSDLVLSVRRDSLSEVWNMHNGLRPHERFDRPFGAGWSSSLAPTLDVDYDYSGNRPTYYYVTDQNGASHRFVAASDGTAVPLPSDQRENGDYLSSLDPYGMVFKDRFGTTIQFDYSSPVTVTVPGDRYTVSMGDSHWYYRALSVSDRLGYTLNYVYPSDATTLIPSTISLAGHPDQTLYIRQDSLCHVTDTWDPNGNHFQYNYQPQGAYTVDGITCNETVLQSVTGPDGKSTVYAYDQQTEPDQTPADLNQGESIDQVHLDIQSIKNPRGYTTSFVYTFDHSRYDYDASPNSQSYYLQTGAPRNVQTVTLPGISTPTQFTNQSSVKLQFDANGKATFAAGSVRQNQVIDTEGHAVTYTFNGAQVFDVAGIYAQTPLWAVPRIIFYTGMTVDYQGVGSETFAFDPNAGLSLASATDLCGHTTSYTHQSSYANATSYQKVLACPNQPNFFGYYEDPDKQTDAATIPKSFTYTSDSWHLLSDVVDEDGRHTHYGFDNLGRRTEEDIYDAGGVLVQQTTFGYDDADGFPGFLNQQTVHKLGLRTDPTKWGGDLVTQYLPDFSGRVAKKIIDPSGQGLVTSYAYDNNGNKLSETDPRQNTTYFSYDARNRLTYVTYPDGSQKQFGYDENGNKKLETDENGHATLYAYDALNRLTSKARDMNSNGLIDPGVDLVTSYGYNNVSSPTTVTDPNGNTTTKKYDALQRVIEIDQPLLPATTLSYDPALNCGGNLFDSSSFKPTSIKDPAGYVTNVTYDVLYRPTVTSRQYQLDPALFATTSTGYDNVGNPTSQTDARHNTTYTSYDALNRPYYVQYPDSTAAHPDYAQTTYTSTGLKWQEQDRCQNVTETRYDGAGRPTDVYAPAVYDAVSGNTLSPHTQSVFDANGNLVAVLNPRGYESDFTFDARNRRTDEYEPAVFDADSGQTLRPHVHTDYDFVGNKTAVTDARGNQTTYLPDPANRITLVTSPAVPLDGDTTQLHSPTTQTTYDLNGNVVQVVDANTHATHNYYDALNRLVVTVNPLQEGTQYGYDALGNRTLVKAGLRQTGSSGGVPTLAPGSNPQTSTFAFDGLKRNTATVYPSGGTTFTYDGAVKLSRQDGNGHTTNYDQYDLCERLLHVSYPDSAADNRTYAYDNESRILAVTDNRGAVTGVAYAYDALGRVRTETSNATTHTYQYDLAGNRQNVQYGVPGGGNGRLLVSSYDALNRLATLVDGANTTAYQYDLGGNVREKLLANGEVETTDYDAAGRQSDSSDQTAGGALLYAYNYGHDPLGNLTTMVEYKAGLPVRTVGMSYYDNDRLQTESVYAGASKRAPLSGSTTYVYDEMGNRLQRQVAGGATTTYAYNAAGQLVGWSDTVGGSVTYGYDGNGNRATRTQNNATDTYGYDEENRLLSLGQGATGTPYAYLYDYRTRRVDRTEGSTATSVVFSGGTSVAEYRPAATSPSVEFIRGSDWGGGVGGILYSVRGGSSGGGTSFDHYDGRGDVATQTSGAATVTYQANYEAWGTRTAEFGQDQDRQRANTKEEDPTGLLDEGRRYRDLETGSFITRDPMGMIDGPNLYAYVNQNPWTKFDPEGLSAAEAAAKLAKEELEVGGRAVIHAEWAGKTIKPMDLPETIANRAKLAEKYPDGVRYTEKGRPDFTPYARPGSLVEFEEGVISGSMAKDEPIARDALRQKGFTDEQIVAMEKDHTWHHVEGGQAMELVPSDLHDAYRHTGGRADIKSGNWFKRALGTIVDSVFSHTEEAHATGGNVGVGLAKDGLDMTDAAMLSAPAQVGAAMGDVANGRVNEARAGMAEREVNQYGHSGNPEMDRANQELLRSIHKPLEQ